MEEQEYVTKHSRHMVEQVLQYIEKQQKAKDAKTSTSILMHFIAGLTSAIVFSSLKSQPKDEKPMSNKQLHDFVMKSFLDTKLSMQEAVAAGFQGGMNTFSGQNIEYYCCIKTVPEPLNKKAV